MTQNSNGPEMVETSRVRESNAVVAEANMPQLIARPVPVQTSGRLEFAARCPKCHDWHRHVALGIKIAPCGAHYLLEFKGAA
ncbi:hypothetical protein [Streptomyces sp. NPDC005141]